MPGEPPTPPELEALRAQTAPPPTPEASGQPAIPLPEQLAFLQNRFVLGTLALVVVLLLVAIVLIALGSGDGGPARPLALAESTPTAPAQSGAPLVGRIRNTASTHNGPARAYAILGTIPGGTLVTLIGRNEDQTWLQVVYPPGSQLHAWVDASFLEMTGDVSRLPLAGPGAGPSVIVPTQVLPTATPTATVTPGTTGTPATTTPGLTGTPPTPSTPAPTALATTTTPTDATPSPTPPPPTAPIEDSTPEAPST